MLIIIKKLALMVALLAAASATLLLSDKKRAGPHIPQVAIFQHASTPVLDDGVRGYVDGLAAKGFVDGSTVQISRFNAEGDLANSNTIAQEIVNRHYDLVLTSSTPSMQAIANANRDGKVMHVFGLVADPFSAGVGIRKEDGGKHPRHLMGLGSLAPVENAFNLARMMLPGLQTVGVVWNPAESNSQVFTGMARVACKQKNITLLEANAENSSAVAEACASLISRGVQAIWVGGDNTVSSVISVVIDVARKGKIPVFSILPGKPERGTFFDIGNDFFVIGKMTGEIAAELLQGADPDTVMVRDVSDVVPSDLFINLRVLKDLKEPWHVPDEVLKMATVVIDDKGVHRKRP